MGLVSKLKNILFEEEEVEIPVIEKKKEKKIEPVYEVPKKEEPKQDFSYARFYEETPREPIYQEKKVEPVKKYEQPSAPIKTESTFNFPDFDEKEFESARPKRSTNIMEYEKKKQEKEKKVEYKRPERKEEEKTPKAKFKPSPIISPVYGILDKNYTPDEITTKPVTPLKSLDVDSVRKKAFGSLEEKKELEKIEIEKIDNQEEDKILEEKLEKARTIDELLKDSSDDYIDVKGSEEQEDKSVADDIDSLENIEESVEPKKEENLEEDTLESDLFDLIDSMYENREGDK